MGKIAYGASCVWLDTDWQTRSKITFNNLAQTTNDLVDFPVLVTLSTANLASLDLGATVGADVRFTDAITGNELKYEVETWDAGADTATIWVKVPTIDKASNTDYIYIYYNHSVTPTYDQSAADEEAVWDVNYAGVWHLEEQVVDEQTSGTHDDSAGSQTGTQSGNEGVVGKIGGAQDFDGTNDYVTLGGAESYWDGSPAGKTFSFWIKREGAGTAGSAATYGVLGKGAGHALGHNFGENESDSVFVVRTNTTNAASSLTVTNNTWYHVAVVADATDFNFYIDGSFDTAQAYTYGGDNGVDLRLGTAGQNYWNGIVDELRISDTERSADWIKASYLSQKDNPSFNAFGSEETSCGATLSHFSLSHDGSYSNCLAETVTVTAKDNLDAPLVNFVESITLDTQSGKGNWTVSSGNGVLVDAVADDGLATYTYDILDSGAATFFLSYQQGTETLDVDSFLTSDSLIRDDDTEPSLVFGTGPAWFNTDWPTRSKITFNNLAQTTDDLVDFPVLVTLSTANLASLNLGATVGAAVRFTDAITGNELKYEVETWDAGADTATIWVKVPQIDKASNTDYIYIYYNHGGTPTYTQSAADEAAVWDVNYAGVWHLGEQVTDEQTSGTHEDSTGANDGVQGSNSSVTGQIGGAQHFDGSDYIDIDAVTDDIDVTKGTFSAWIQLDPMSSQGAVLSTVLDGNSKIEVKWWNGDDSLTFQYREGGANLRADDPVYDDTSDVWNYATLTWDTVADEVKVYTDGAQFGATLTGASALVGTLFEVSIGARGNVGRTAGMIGDVDEVRVSSIARSADWHAASYLSQKDNPSFNAFGNEDTLCVSGPAHFSLSHDGSGINCVAETVTVTAKDQLDAPLVTFVESITLDTQSGKGTWTVSSGNGVFSDVVADDGLAIYTYDILDSGAATFLLSYQQGTATLDVDSFLTSDSLIRDDDAESNLVFGPSGFTFTQSALSNPPPNPINDPVATQTAGSSFNVYMAAYGQTPEDPACGVIETYTGTKSISFWFDYDDPLSGTLTPTINASPISATEGGASGQDVVFTSGQASVVTKYKDVGLIRVHGKDSTIPGATNLFVVKPSAIVITDIETVLAVNNPAASSATGAGFVAAGEAFNVVIEVQDAEGSRTPNFGNEISAEGLLVVASSLVIPAAGRNGSADDGAIANGASFTATTPAGTFSSNTLSWDEYGIIKLQPSIADDDYLGTGAITGTESGNVGRFYAAGFTLTSGTVVAACNGFTYMDQNALTVNYDLEARNTLGNVLYNYDTGLLGSSGVATPVYHAENNNQGSDVIARLPISGTTAILPWRQAPSSLPVTAALMDHTRCCSWACRSVMDLTGLPSRVRI